MPEIRPSLRHRAFPLIAAGLVAATLAGLAGARAQQRTGGTTSPVPTARTSSPSIKSRRSNVGQLEVAWFYPYATAGFNPIVVDDVMYVLGRGQLAHRARCHDRQGALDPRGPRRHHQPRRQLLAERGRQGQAAAVLDQQLPAGDRRHDRQVDPDVRRGRHRRSAQRPRARRDVRRPDPVEQPRQDLEEPADPRIGAGRSVRESARRHPRVRRHHRARRSGSSTRFRCRASSATRPGRRRPTSTSAASTTGARCRSTTSAASSTSRSGPPTTTSTAPIASGRISSPTASSRSTRRPASGSGTSRRCTTISGTSTTSSAPQLVTVPHNGRKVDAVAHAGKTGFLYVFDRVTGKPLWPIEERPVPKSEMPGEQAWPTQPFPTKPAPFVRQTFTVDDVNPWLATPEQYEAMKERVAKARNEGHLHAAGADGHDLDAGQPGRSRTGARRPPNPQKGMVFVVGVNQVAILKLEDVTNAHADAGRGGGGGQGSARAPGGFAGVSAVLHRVPWRRPARRAAGRRRSSSASPIAWARTRSRRSITGGKGSMRPVSSITDAR